MKNIKFLLFLSVFSALSPLRTNTMEAEYIPASLPALEYQNARQALLEDISAVLAKPGLTFQQAISFIKDNLAVHDAYYFRDYKNPLCNDSFCNDQFLLLKIIFWVSRMYKKDVVAIAIKLEMETAYKVVAHLSQQFPKARAEIINRLMIIIRVLCELKKPIDQCTELNKEKRFLEYIFQNKVISPEEVVPAAFFSYAADNPYILDYLKALGFGAVAVKEEAKTEKMHD